jgi:hypothetical protein
MTAVFEDGATFEDGGCKSLIYKKMAKMAAKLSGGSGANLERPPTPKGLDRLIHHRYLSGVDP